MLTPVPRFPETDALRGATGAQATRPQSDEMPPQAAAPAADDGNGLSAKAALAALASEIHLSRSTAVLVETLGKLMALPRNDGEAVETYVARLTEALRALPAPQRLALEQQLSRVLRGFSLSMLAEILKQPTGPDAARLALLIELSRYRGADLAARAVVSSYQQNNSVSHAPSPSTPRKPHSAPVQNIEARQSQVVLAQPANSAMSSRLLPLITGTVAFSGAAVKATVAALIARPDARLSLSASPASGADLPYDAAKPNGRTENATRPVPPQTGSEIKQTPEERWPAQLSRAETAEMRPPFSQKEAMKAEQKDARPAPAAASGQSPTDPTTENNLLTAAAPGKIATKGAATWQPPVDPQGIAPQSLKDQPAEKEAISMAAARHSGEETEAITPRPETQPLASAAALDPEKRLAMLEQSASQSLIAAVLAREGTPLPLVAYPPADEEYEPESPPHGGGPFSDDDANGEAEAEAEDADGEDDTEERIAANDEIAPQEASPAAASGDSAENYYLRISGMH